MLRVILLTLSVVEFLVERICGFLREPCFSAMESVTVHVHYSYYEFYIHDSY